MANNGMERNEHPTDQAIDRMKNISLSRCFPKRNAARCKTKRVDISKCLVVVGGVGVVGARNWQLEKPWPIDLRQTAAESCLPWLRVWIFAPVMKFPIKFYWISNWGWDSSCWSDAFAFFQLRLAGKYLRTIVVASVESGRCSANPLATSQIHPPTAPTSQNPLSLAEWFLMAVQLRGHQRVSIRIAPLRMPQSCTLELTNLWMHCGNA